MEKNETHSGPFPVSNKAARAKVKPATRPKSWMGPDPLSPPSPVSLLFTCCSLLVLPSLLSSFMFYRQIRCFSHSWTHTARGNLEPGQTVHGTKNTWCLFLPTGWCFCTTGHQTWCLGGGWASKRFSTNGILPSLCPYFSLSFRWWLLGGGDRPTLMKEEADNSCCQGLFFLPVFFLLPSNVFLVLCICLLYLCPSVHA